MTSGSKNSSEKNLLLNEKRKFIRHPICLPLTYEILEKSAPKSGEEKISKTINVSLGGLLFPAKCSVNPGAFIKISLPFEDRVFNVKAMVVHCEKDAHTRLYNIGVSFKRMQEAFKTKMIEQIYLISEFRDLKSMQLGRQVSLEEASREWISRYSARFKRLYW